MKLLRKFLRTVSFMLAPFWLIAIVSVSLSGICLALIISFFRRFDS